MFSESIALPQTTSYTCKWNSLGRICRYDSNFLKLDVLSSFLGIPGYNCLFKSRFTISYSVLAQTAIRKLHRLGGWNNKHISQSFGGWRFQDQGSSRFSFRWGPFPGLLTATFLLYPHMVERDETLVSSSSYYKDTDPIMGPSPMLPLLNLITSSSPHSKYHHTVY